MMFWSGMSLDQVLEPIFLRESSILHFIKPLLDTLMKKMAEPHWAVPCYDLVMTF